MSNDLAIATVTAGLQRLVSQALIGSPLDGTTVSIQRPDDPGQDDSARITVFLYQVSHNAAWRNDDLPTRDAAGNLVRRPQVALDLDYLLSFFGASADLEPDRLLGLTARQIHSAPVLSRALLDDAISASAPFLDDSDLPDQVVPVKLTPLALNLEELSKVWSVFFQTPYVLSVAYRASVVLIEDEVAARRALPVRQRELVVAPLRRPVIDCAVADDDPDAWIFGDSVLAVEGSQLAGSVVRVRIGDQELDPDSLSDRRITVDLAPAGLNAGIHRVQIVQPLAGEAEHLRFASNAVPFVLHPRILGEGSFVAAVGDQPARVEAALDAPVEDDQQLVLLLNELLEPDDPAVPRAFVFEARADDETVLPGDTVSIPVDGVPDATYLIRVQVDGAESPLVPDGDGRFELPIVTVP